jgi:hypothetical protein
MTAMGVTPQQFRRFALSHSGAEERSHMKHPDFRVGGKIFASLGYPDNEHAMVKLTPELQNEFMKREPQAFRPAAGAWGRAGSTTVSLKSAPKSVLQEAITAAVRLVMTPPKRSAKQA